jgi:SDR family mycofactocin-dependent oxidoreductase
MGLVEGKVAFITGAARGQGREHARRLAEEGADIIAVDICADIESIHYPMGTEEELRETAALVEKEGRSVLLRQVDVRTLDELRDAVAAGLAQFGHIDIVVANAGVMSMAIDPPDAELDAVWDVVMAVNLRGAWNTLRACTPAMVERGQGGSVILTSSTAGLKGGVLPGVAGADVYSISKHGLVGLMRSSAAELAKDSIRVNSIHPTGVATAMVGTEAMREYFGSRPETASIPTNLLPVAVLQPSDVSDTVVYLASDLSRYITGVTLPVDAGFTAK